MAAVQFFTVATLGFEQRERRLLQNVLAISEHRSPEFKSYVRADKSYPHIVLINADIPEAMRNWEKFRDANQHRARLSAVYLSRGPVSGAGKYVLHRPILATRLFQLLEQVVTENHGYRSPLAIDADESMVVLGGDESPKNAAPTAVASLNASAVAELARTRASTPAATPPTPRAQPGRAAAAQAPAGFVALVVDDSLPVRIQMKSALKSLATHVDFAETGEQGLEFIEKRAYSIVFLDVILPGKDGYEICRRIKKHPLQQRTPVVMLTGNSSPADRVKGRLAGCDTYLMKPVKQSVFEQLVAEFMRAHAAA
jgi:twitching motility two-component system response regulator PilG